ncbi:MAG: hypothetical protein ABSA45_08470 [Verrucomicrobiota bacterium]|jgi:hypothetical protein
MTRPNGTMPSGQIIPDKPGAVCFCSPGDGGETRAALAATKDDQQRIVAVDNAAFGRRGRNILTAVAIKAVQYQSMLPVRQQVIRGMAANRRMTKGKCACWRRLNFMPERLSVRKVLSTVGRATIRRRHPKTGRSWRRMAAIKKNTANVFGLRENSVMTESEKLKSRAGDLTVLAIISLFGATACAIAALWPHYMNSENPVRWIWLYISASLCSTAVFFFFFAQLFHIRAALEKRP